MRRYVVSLDGPIGVGKTTLGKEAARRLGFGFIDGDDHSPAGPWIESALRTSRSIVAAGKDMLRDRPGIIIAYPVRCVSWIYFRRSFMDAGFDYRCAGLIAAPEHISRRKRSLSADEVTRSAEMIAQGYGQRPFSDLVIRTDKADFEETCRDLTDELRHMMQM